MNLAQENSKNSNSRSTPTDKEDAFSRLDENDDRRFYQTDRFVSHLDSLALATVEKLIGTLIVERNPVILDLMAGWDSHIPEDLFPAEIVGLGLNENELRQNQAHPYTNQNIFEPPFYSYFDINSFL